MRNFIDWLLRRKKPAPVSKLQPLILQSSDAALPWSPAVEHDACQIEEAESNMNVALRAIVNVMAVEGLITRDQAREFTDTHAVVVAYRRRGLGALLRGIGMGEDDIKANRSRVTVVRLPTRDRHRE